MLPVCPITARGFIHHVISPKGISLRHLMFGFWITIGPIAPEKTYLPIKFQAFFLTEAKYLRSSTRFVITLLLVVLVPLLTSLSSVEVLRIKFRSVVGHYATSLSIFQNNLQRPPLSVASFKF